MNSQCLVQDRDFYTVFFEQCPCTELLGAKLSSSGQTGLVEKEGQEGRVTPAVSLEASKWPKEVGTRGCGTQDGMV